MSIKAMSWVMDESPVENTTEMVVLYVLADHARNDGTCSWPSHATIADKSRCSRRTVIRHINSLEERGLIHRGDQRFVAHLPADKRPVVWNLNMAMKRDQPNEAGCQNVTSQPSGVTLSAERGDNGGKSGVTLSAERGDTGVTQPVLDPSVEPSMTLRSSGDDPGSDDPFNEFWGEYPRKIGDKRKAKAKFHEIAEEHGPDSLVNAARNYAKECEQQERAKSYTPHPFTFLNQGRWKDYLQASRSSAPSSDEVLGWSYKNIKGEEGQEVSYELPF